MKKIVALVLSLVMVLGLATVAFGYEDEKTYYMADGTAVMYMAAEHDADTGAGDLEWFYTASGNYVAAVKGEEGAVAVYAKAGALEGDTVLGYIKPATTAVSYSMTGTAVAASKLSCTTGQNAKGYYDAIGEKFYVKDTDGTADYWMLVDGKLVAVKDMPNVVDASHVLYKYQTAPVSTGVYAYKCAVCGQVFNCTTDKALAGANPAKYTLSDSVAAADVFYAAGYLGVKDVTKTWPTSDMFIIGAGAPEAAETDKVESAETFDAGIAMYVGMSVMAAAGSAVVLKKKD